MSPCYLQINIYQFFYLIVDSGVVFKKKKPPLPKEALYLNCEGRGFSKW